MEEGGETAVQMEFMRRAKENLKLQLKKKKGELSSLKGRRTNSILSATLSTALGTSSDPSLSLNINT